MKKQKIILMFVSFIFILMISINSYAAMGKGFFDGKIDGNGTSSVFGAGSGIINLFQTIGIGVAVIATLVLGIRYMISSPDERAGIKKQLIPWIVGGILIFGAIQIVKIIETFVTT